MNETQQMVIDLLGEDKVRELQKKFREGNKIEALQEAMSIVLNTQATEPANLSRTETKNKARPTLSEDTKQKIARVIAKAVEKTNGPTTEN